MSATQANQSRSARRAVRRVEKALGPELQPGEAVEVAMLAQRWLPFVEAFLLFGPIGDAIFLIVAKPYYIAATNMRFFMLEAGRFWPAARGQVFSATLDAVRIEELRRGPVRRTISLRQLGGSDYRLAVHRSYRRQLERLEQLVGH